MLSENLWDAEVRRGAVVTRSSSRAASRAIWVLLILFVSLQVADVVTTNYALAVPGKGRLGGCRKLPSLRSPPTWCCASGGHGRSLVPCRIIS